MSATSAKALARGPDDQPAMTVKWTAIREAHLGTDHPKPFTAAKPLPP
jgi:hypothetical protein